MHKNEPFTALVTHKEYIRWLMQLTKPPYTSNQAAVIDWLSAYPNGGWRHI